jgi:hypothetical protein
MSRYQQHYMSRLQCEIASSFIFGWRTSSPVFLCRFIQAATCMCPHVIIGKDQWPLFWRAKHPDHFTSASFSMCKCSSTVTCRFVNDAARSKLIETRNLVYAATFSPSQAFPSPHPKGRLSADSPQKCVLSKHRAPANVTSLCWCLTKNPERDP